MKFKPKKINSMLPKSIKPVEKPMGNLSLEVYLKNNGMDEKQIKEFFEMLERK